MLNIQLQKVKFSNFVWYTFLIMLILDMGGGIGLKNLSFLLTLGSIFVLLVIFKVKLNILSYISEIFIFGVMPFFVIAYSTLILSIPITEQLNQVTAFATFIALVLVVNMENKEMLIQSVERVALLSGVVVIVTFVGIYLLNFLGMNNYISIINLYTRHFNAGYIGVNPISSTIGFFLPNVYYVWSMLLIPFTLIFIKKNKLRFFLLGIASILTLSAGIVLFLVIGFLLLLYMQKRMSWNIKISYKSLTLFFVIMVFGLIGFKLGVFDIFLEKLNPNSISTSTKLGHIQSVLTEIFKSYNSFLFGMGLGSAFFSIGVNAEVVNIEVSHFNLIRQFGILYFLLFTSYVFWMAYQSAKIDFEGKKIAAGLIAIFFVAGTNPLLISPVFFVWVIITKGYVVLSKKKVT